MSSPHCQSRASPINRRPVSPHPDPQCQPARPPAPNPPGDAPSDHTLPDSPPVLSDPDGHVTSARLDLAHAPAEVHDEFSANALHPAPAAAVPHLDHASGPPVRSPAHAYSDAEGRTGEADSSPSAVISAGISQTQVKRIFFEICESTLAFNKR